MQQPFDDWQPPQPSMPYPVGATPPATAEASIPSVPNQIYPGGTADQTAAIPPHVEGDPYPAQVGGYCYVGPHPVDTRVAPGPSWDPTEGQHIRAYPPVDMRLFSFRDGCYYFTGDPRDFGFGGSTFPYYGAHPVLGSYGGGWCFMMGGHAHLWRPWSPYFAVVGSWNYWQGPYDPFFWSYWPYYSHYYRSYYPHFYGGGRFNRGGGFHVAPPIRSVPGSSWRGDGFARTAPPTRGAPPGPHRGDGAQGGGHFAPPRGGFAPPQGGGFAPRHGGGGFAPRHGGGGFAPSPRGGFGPSHGGGGLGSHGPRGGGGRR